jgi:mannan endo-1,4-beta-mannosidase
VVLLAAIAVLVGTTQGSKNTASDFVRTRGSQFTIAGRPFRFVGFNIYDAAAAGEGFYSCETVTGGRYTEAQLDSALRYMHQQAGATVLRFWAYQTYTRSGEDWSGIDEVLKAARANGMRVIPVLEDGPGYCTTGPAGMAKYEYQNDTWYSAGYKKPYGTADLSYRAYVQKIVARYRNNPTILGWEMMNEATSPARVDGEPVIETFARSIGSLIHSIDPNHLVTVGTESDGYPGASGADFRAVYALPEIDFGSAHDYEAPGQGGDYDPIPMNGLQADGDLPSPASTLCQPSDGAPLACSVAIARQLGKPMVIDEVAVPASSSDRAALQSRAGLFDRKLAAGFDHGVSGELVWTFSKVEEPQAGDFDVLATDHDPLIPVMRSWADKLAGRTAGAAAG